MKISRRSVATVASLFAVLCVPAIGHGQSLEEFYRSHSQIVLYTGFGPGTAYDVWGRTVTKTMTKFMPGKPTFVLQNMPGAGSLTLANYLYNQAPKDGTVIGSFSRNLPLQAMLGLENANFDSRKFGWIGSPELTGRVCAVTARSGIASVEDLRKKDVLVGGAGVATAISFMPLVLNQLAGTKFKVIEGYRSDVEIFLAMERGEVDEICQSYLGILQVKGEAIRNGTFRILFGIEEKRNPALKDVPSIVEFIEDPEKKQILSFINSSTELGRPYAAPPGLPKDRLDALRDAFDKTMMDAEFLKDAAAQKLDVTVTPGQELDRILNNLFSMPKSIVDKATALMPSEKSGG